MPPRLAVSLALAVTLATTLPVLPVRPTHAFADFGDFDVMAPAQLRPAAGPPPRLCQRQCPRAWDDASRTGGYSSRTGQAGGGHF